MFEILYRITDKTKDVYNLAENPNDSGDIEGFFAINVNGEHYGHYHDNPLGDDESGWYLITGWFINLLLAYKRLCESDYVAVNDIESFNSWIEFKKENGLISVSLIKAKKPAGTAELQLTPFNEFSYGEWYQESVNLDEIHIELFNKATLYIEEIRKINAKLLVNAHIAQLEALVLQLQKK